MGKEVILIDTSILCEILRVPRKCEKNENYLDKMKEYEERGCSLLLPLATIIETGNHIGRLKSGQQRRNWATRLRNIVMDALNGKSPFGISDYAQSFSIEEIIRDFPDAATGGFSLGDHSIVLEFKQLCPLYQGRRVRIWSTEERLSAYDRLP